MIPTPSNKQIVFKLLMNKFNDPAVVAGIMGNIGHETGGSFDYLQQQFGGGPGRGLIQMEGKMLDAYNKFLSINKLTDSGEAQIDFIKNIIDSDDNYDIGAGHRKKLVKIFKSGDPALIAEEFSTRVERPGKPQLEKRKKLALEYFGKIRRK